MPHRGRILLAMPGGQPVRVVLELEPDDPVRGTIVGPDEGREAFYGWLELAGGREASYAWLELPAALGRMRPPPPAVDGSSQVTLLGDGSLIPETGQL